VPSGTLSRKEGNLRAGRTFHAEDVGAWSEVLSWGCYDGKIGTCVTVLLEKSPRGSDKGAVRVIQEGTGIARMLK